MKTPGTPPPQTEGPNETIPVAKQSKMLKISLKSNFKTKPAIVNLDLESYWSNGEPLSPRINFFKTFNQYWRRFTFTGVCLFTPRTQHFITNIDNIIKIGQKFVICWSAKFWGDLRFLVINNIYLHSCLDHLLMKAYWRTSGLVELLGSTLPHPVTIELSLFSSSPSGMEVGRQAYWKCW